MPVIRIYVRPISFKNWPGVESMPLIEFAPIADDDAGQVKTFGQIEATLGKCYPSDIEIPEGYAVVESSPGHRYVEMPDGSHPSAYEIVARLTKGEPGYRLISGE
jgi:hypothetical protein